MIFLFVVTIQKLAKLRDTYKRQTSEIASVYFLTPLCFVMPGGWEKINFLI